MLSSNDKTRLTNLFNEIDDHNLLFGKWLEEIIENISSVEDLTLLLKEFKDLSPEDMQALAKNKNIDISALLKDKFSDSITRQIEPRTIANIKHLIQEFGDLHQEWIIKNKDVNSLIKDAKQQLDLTIADARELFDRKKPKSQSALQLPPRGKIAHYPTRDSKEDKPVVRFFGVQDRHNASPVPYAILENPEPSNVVVRVLRHPGLSSIFTGFSKLLDRVKIEYHKVQETRSKSQKIKHNLKHEHKAEQARKKAEKRADSVILNNIAKALEQIKHKIKEQAKQTIKDIENAKDKAEVENILKKFQAFVEKQSNNLPQININIPKLDISKLGPAVDKAMDKISTYSEEFKDAIDKTANKHYEKLDQLEIKKGLIYIDGKFQSANCHQLLGTITAKLNEENGNLIPTITAGGFHSDIKFKLIPLPLDNTFTLKADISPQGTPPGTPPVTFDVIKINANDMTYPSKKQYTDLLDLSDLSELIYQRDISALVAIQAYIFKEILGKTSKSTLKIEHATDKQFIEPLSKLITDPGNKYEIKEVKLKMDNPTNVTGLEEIKQQLHDHNARVKAKSSGVTQDVDSQPLNKPKLQNPLARKKHN